MSAEEDERHGEIGISPELTMKVITDQAGTLVDGWREATQNGIDSPGSTGVSVEYTPKRTVIRDDGNGIDLTDEKGEELLSNLGASNKERDDSSTIGHFGIGKGQIFAKARVTIMSGGVALHFDIKNWGTEFDRTELEQPVDGVVVVMNHYESEVPDESDRKWDEYESDFEKRFKYTTLATDKQITFNGTCVSDNNPRDEVKNRTHWEYKETEDAYIALQQNKWGNISVYSNGVFVKDLSRDGFSGVVVTKKNIEVNFARNDIQAGCSVWETVREQVDSVKKDVLEDIPDGKLNRKTRKTLVQMMAEDEETRDRFSDKSVFKEKGGNLASLDKIQRQDEIGFAGRTSTVGEKVSDRGDQVLDEGDNTVEILQEKDFELPNEFDVEERAMERGVTDGYNTIHDVELQASQKRRLSVARTIAEKIGTDRLVVWGDDSSNKAWTDGESIIAITGELFDSESHEAGIVNAFHAICKQSVCNTDTTSDSPSSTTDFHRKYGRKISQNEWVLDRVLEMYEQGGYERFVPEMTEPEIDRANMVRKKLERMEPGDEFKKNDNTWTTEVIEVTDDYVVVNPPRKDQERIYIDGKDTFPVMDPYGTDQTVWDITEV